MRIVFLCLALSMVIFQCQQNKSAQPSVQNPSPMEEYVRPHTRISTMLITGFRDEIANVFDKPVHVFIPEHTLIEDAAAVLIHFHGSSFVAEYAASKAAVPIILLSVNFGNGSSVYEKPLLTPGIFDQLLRAVESIARKNNLSFSGDVFLSAYSAGYGAVRACLSQKVSAENILGILLMDGLHTGYIPDGKVRFQGGTLDTSTLKPFLEFAIKATEGKKKFIFNHTEIFPGTYASTTECADYILQNLNLKRNPVLKEGPLGMQQLSETMAGGLMINAFAGNTAPDHVDQYHAMYYYLDKLLN